MKLVKLTKMNYSLTLIGPGVTPLYGFSIITRDIFIVETFSEYHKKLLDNAETNIKT